MMTVAKVGGGRLWYYETLGREDDHSYYTKEEKNELEPDGVWIGTGAERIGLEGKVVENKTFRNLMKGYDPTGKEEWVTNAGKFEGTKRDRMPGWDITFSAPKSVSVAWAIGGDESRRQIEKAHQEAVREAVQELEKKCIVRSGKGGRIKEPGGFIAGVFQHGTARQVDKKTPPDMQLHSHVVIVNTALTRQGKRGAVNGVELLEKGTHHQHGAIYRALLAQKLNKLGFQTEKTKDGFELKCIPRAVIEHFSKRGKQISDKTPRETSTAKEKLKANLLTRMAKTDTDPKRLQLYWKEQALSFGLTSARIEAGRTVMAPQSTEQRWKQAMELVGKVADHLAKTKGTFTKKELNQAAIQASGETGLTVREIAKATGAFVTGKEVLRLEMRRDEKGAGTERLYSTKANQDAIAKKAQMEQLSDRLEAENVRELKRVLQKQGFKVIGCAIKKDTVDKMTKAGMKSSTVSKLLQDHEKRAVENATKPANMKEAAAELGKNVAKSAFADFNYLTGKWSKRQRDAFKGKEEKPSSEWMHSFKRMTGQITEQQEKHLNNELQRKSRSIDSKTIVFVNAPESYREKASVQRLIAAVEAQGGTVIVAQAQGLDFSSSIHGEVLQNQERLRAAKAQPSDEQKKKEEERQRTRQM